MTGSILPFEGQSLIFKGTVRCVFKMMEMDGARTALFNAPNYRETLSSAHLPSIRALGTGG
jgi:hypothetical protein